MAERIVERLIRERDTRYGDGIYTLECRTHPQTSRGNDQHTFMVGNVEERQPGRVAGVAQVNPAVGFFQGMDARYFMDQISGATTEKQNMQMELFRKELEIDRLKRELKDKGMKVTPADRIFGLLEKNPKIIEGILSGNGVAVGLLKADKPIPETPENGVDDSEEYEDAYTPGKLDMNALVECAMRIQTAMPDVHVNETLDGLADWIETNPTQAREYLKMLLG